MSQVHLYIATDGDLLKIGVSMNPGRRMGQHGKAVRLLHSWRRPYARALEASIKGTLAYCCARGSEWFRISESEMLAHVRRTIRIHDDERAMEAGFEPSPRPLPGQPPFVPPFELNWLTP